METRMTSSNEFDSVVLAALVRASRSVDRSVTQVSASFAEGVTL